MDDITIKQVVLPILSEIEVPKGVKLTINLKPVSSALEELKTGELLIILNSFKYKQQIKTIIYRKGLDDLALRSFRDLDLVIIGAD